MKAKPFTCILSHRPPFRANGSEAAAKFERVANVDRVVGRKIRMTRSTWFPAGFWDSWQREMGGGAITVLGIGVDGSASAWWPKGIFMMPIFFHRSKCGNNHLQAKKLRTPFSLTTCELLQGMSKQVAYDWEANCFLFHQMSPQGYAWLHNCLALNPASPRLQNLCSNCDQDILFCHSQTDRPTWCWHSQTKQKQCTKTTWKQYSKTRQYRKTKQ